MTTILGIDPGWAKKTDSGIALVVGEPGTWRTLKVAPSFASFVSAAPGANVSLDAVLGHAAQLGGGTIDVAAIDIPLATMAISTRRRSDEEVSRRYGGRGCSVHSPTPERPGALADEYRHVLTRAGLPLATTGTTPGTTPAALEVYPHVSLLRLMSAAYRVPYKVGRARSYWKDIATAAARRTRLLLEWRKILDALERVLGPSLVLPVDPRAREMKALEDQLDALVCAWTAVEYLAGRLEPLGDETAAIWCPPEPRVSAEPPARRP